MLSKNKATQLIKDVTTSFQFPYQCGSKLPTLFGWSWLATIAELMGLVRLFPFPWAGSVDTACNIPAPTAHSSLWPSHTYPQDTLQWALWLYSFHTLHSAGHKSLFHSFAISPCVHYHLICLMYAVPFAVPATPISYSWYFASTPSARLFICSSILQLFIDSSLLSLHSPISVHTTSFFPNPPMFFIGAVWTHCQHISYGSDVAQH